MFDKRASCIAGEQFKEKCASNAKRENTATVDVQLAEVTPLLTVTKPPNGNNDITKIDV